MDTLIDLAARFILQAEKKDLCHFQDRVYVFNQLLHRFQIDDFSGPLPAMLAGEAKPHAKDLPELLLALADEACQRGVIEDLSDLRERFMADLVDVFLDKPSQIDARFWQLHAQKPRRATDWFYEFSQATNYIQTQRVAKNIVYEAASPYGTLDITINLSKPEKNPRDIAAAKSAPAAGYPACLLCMENEGFAGRVGHPARSHHRLIRLDFEQEAWYLQYSPYVYYREHCIVLSREHRDMHLSRDTFARLLSFAERFPHYFIGSNADLPIVGGSILSHDHYQGGRYEFAMERAPIEKPVALPVAEGIECGIVRWPMSVLRLSSPQKEGLIAAGDALLEIWRAYSDPAVDIVCETEGTLHNTITPIVRRRGKRYELDLVLRNNRQDKDHPLGIFHPHADVHHIKKENIGLIEVMGLAVLPGRLVEELAAVEDHLRGGPLAKVTPPHRKWAEKLRQEHGTVKAGQSRQIVRQAVADKFARVLEDAGVFKRDVKGQEAWDRFIAHAQKAWPHQR